MIGTSHPHIEFRVDLGCPVGVLSARGFQPEQRFLVQHENLNSGGNEKIAKYIAGSDHMINVVGFHSRLMQLSLRVSATTEPCFSFSRSLSSFLPTCDGVVIFCVPRQTLTHQKNELMMGFRSIDGRINC